MTLFRVTLLCLALLPNVSGCSSNPVFPSSGPISFINGEERRILVTFVDRSIGQNLSGNTQDRYQSHEGYGNSSWSSNLAANLAERYNLRLITEWPVTALGVACVVYEVPLDQAIEKTLELIRSDKQIESVQPMQSFRVLSASELNTASYNDPYYRLQKKLQAMHIEAAQRLATGRGVRVAVIDTGIDTHHPDLSQQIAASENLAALGQDENTDDVHGTAVAGVIAAQSRNGIGIVGIAPDAELFGLRACRPEHPGAAEALCNSFTLALAVNEAIRLDTHIINLSLAGPDDPLVKRLLYAAMNKGVLIVASEADENNPGKDFPANLDGVIAVRSSKPGQVQNARSNLLTAPGSEVLTTVPHSTYDFMSGSSFAAPHITGLLALMREVKPTLTGAEALHVLHSMPQTNASISSDIDACLALAGLGEHLNRCEP